MIDLQMHSIYSDGSMTPTELVHEAKSLGLTAIALTDHDTIDGLSEFVNAASQMNMVAVPGVEISTDSSLPNHGHLHLLGLFIDPSNPILKNKLNFLRYQRNKRAKQILDKLNILGIKLGIKDLQREAGDSCIGRPHIAKILVKQNIVSSLQEAFDIYLAKGKPAYVEKIKFDEQNAIGLIKEAGGLAILAHPHLMNYATVDETKYKIMQLKEFGLDGFEVYYPTMPQSFSLELIHFAEENGFAISGGSDYHGKNKEGIFMGIGKGDLKIPDHIYFRLKEKWENEKKSKSFAER